jgi:hypothetical protein
LSEIMTSVTAVLATTTLALFITTTVAVPLAAAGAGDQASPVSATTHSLNLIFTASVEGELLPCGT